ncbi:MAG: TIGR04206 family protein [Halobacteriaceae archaeon]
MTRRALAVAALAAVPWSVQTYASGAVSVVFAWGLLGLDPLSVTTLPGFLDATSGLPAYIESWPLSVGLWLTALASATVGALTDHDDARVTAGLLAVAGGAALDVSTGFSVQPGRTAYPTGTVALWAVAAWSLYRR